MTAQAVEALPALRRMAARTGLPDRVVDALADIAVIRQVRAGEVVQLEGDPAEAMYVVLNGRVKIMRTASNGREQVLHIAGPGDHINLVPILDDGPNPATVQAITDAVLAAVPCEPLRQLMMREPAFTMALLRDLARRQRHLVTLVDELALHCVQGRLARLLLSRAEAAERGEAVPPLTQAEMASQIGTVREMVSRTLRNFEELGLIAVERGVIVVRDRAGLEQRAEQ
ncbi:MAG: Crp/Fnr family transcriptional regulator [Anaerolineae bacterium]|jgi:CRP/FNR family cyclic AMP-dependent transcriptional regulator|nr:Crp/Fnr family transcriptional regulator [Anaerolineae bacterium]